MRASKSPRSNLLCLFATLISGKSVVKPFSGFTRSDRSGNFCHVINACMHLSPRTWTTATRCYTVCPSTKWIVFSEYCCPRYLPSTTVFPHHTGVAQPPLASCCLSSEIQDCTRRFQGSQRNDSFLIELLHAKTPCQYALRGDSQHLFTVPQMKCRTFGDGSFAAAVACEQAPVGRAERELASSEVERGSGGACGQRLYAAVLCTRFWCNHQLVRSPGLSLRAGDRGFPPATRSLSPGYFDINL